jgi:hypothetical protein
MVEDAAARASFLAAFTTHALEALVYPTLSTVFCQDVPTWHATAMAALEVLGDALCGASSDIGVALWTKLCERVTLCLLDDIETLTTRKCAGLLLARLLGTKDKPLHALHPVLVERVWHLEPPHPEATQFANMLAKLKISLS